MKLKTRRKGQAVMLPIDIITKIDCRTLEEFNEAFDAMESNGPIETMVPPKASPITI